MISLQDYIKSEIGKPFILGTNDCIHFVNGWIKNVTQRDALACFNGLPQSTAQELLLKGKYLRSIAVGVKSIGLKRTYSPRHGDIGTLRLARNLQIAVLGENGWIYRYEQGINMLKKAPIFACWEVK